MKYLPARPSLDFLRREARTLRGLHRARNTSVADVIGHFDTSFHGLGHEELFARKFSVIDAQRVIARQYGFASWRRLKLFVQKDSHKTSDFHPVLRDELLRRDAMRIAFVRRAKDGRPGSIAKLRDFNAESRALAVRIYERYGWPGPQLIGRDGLEALYWLSLSDHGNGTFQYESAKLMEDALPQGECFGLAYATTIDRWLCLSYKPTRYGCINDFNVDTGRVEYTRDFSDPANINKRRAEVGLPDFESANRELNELTVAQKWPTCSRAEWAAKKRQCALEGGYISA